MLFFYVGAINACVILLYIEMQTKLSFLNCLEFELVKEYIKIESQKEIILWNVKKNILNAQINKKKKPKFLCEKCNKNMYGIHVFAENMQQM